jgi:hypothetical protein
MTGSAPVAFATVAQPLAERGWRPFPGLQTSKIPAMRGWSGLNHAVWVEADLIAAIGDYQPADDFCCCLAVQPEIVATDLDIVDQEHAAFADRLADDVLGRTPLVRIGFAPKQVRIYRNGDTIQSRKLHPLEIFSGTGQIVGYGWHEKAGRPYDWLYASPLDVSADSNKIPLLTQTQLDRFTTELFKVVPRRLLPTGQGRPARTGGPQTIGDRLRMLCMLHRSWKRAAAIILGEAVEGCRNDTAWTVVASAAGRGISADVVSELFEKYFSGWAEVSEAQVASMIERAQQVRRLSPMNFSVSAIAGGGRGNR